MKKVLITGAFGYLGAKLSNYLSAKGYSVTAFDRYIPSGYGQSVSLTEEVIVGDIRDESMISKLAEKQFDVVVHLISLDHDKSEGNPNIVSSINLMPTWNLLDAFTKNGLGKFIYFSTIHVYGKIPKEIINKPPSPDIIPGIIDEEAIGIAYEKLDFILKSLELAWPESKIATILKIKENEVEKVKKLKEKSEHMRQVFTPV